MDEFETPPAADPVPAPEPAPEPTQADKTQAREGYAARQAQKQVETLQRELAEYKRRDEEARKAKLTEEQRVREELETMKAEREQLRLENLRRKIASEYKLPDAMINRMIGSDEDSLRADAESLAELLPRPKVGTPSEPVRDVRAARTYKESELRDRKFYLANEKDIRVALAEGRIERGV